MHEEIVQQPAGAAFFTHILQTKYFLIMNCMLCTAIIFIDLHMTSITRLSAFGEATPLS